MVSAAEEGYAYDDLNIEFYGASEYNGDINRRRQRFNKIFIFSCQNIVDKIKQRLELSHSPSINNQFRR